MSNETYILAYAMADGVAVAHSESAWDALLRGDLDAAFAAKPRYLDPTTGEELGQRQVARIWASASGRKTSTVEKMDAMAGQIYRPGSPWGQGRRS